jgi:ABC-2 type transport system permease protein
VAEARILDRGYRRFEGERGGTAAAIATVVVHTSQRLLGLRRPFRHKLLPLAVAALAYLPAIVFLGAAAILPAQLADALIPGHAEFLPFITTAILLFVVFVAPEALCPDRRHRTLTLYLASPLDRGTYLTAKAGAVVLVLLVVTLGPPLLVQVGYVLVGIVPLGWATAADLARVVAAGVILSVAYGAVGLAGASLTDRRAFAAAGTFVALILLRLGTDIAVVTADAPSWVRALDVSRVPAEAAQRLHGETGTVGEVATATVVVATAAWTLALAALIWGRYRRLTVTR